MSPWKRLRMMLAGAIAAALALAPVPSFATALTITAANVAWVSGPITTDAVSGEAFAAGAVVYLSATGTWLKAKSNGTAVEAGSGGIGVALGTSDATGARVSIARADAVISVGTGTAGTAYALCTVAGSICPVADAATTNKMTVVGVGIGSNKLHLGYIYDAGSVVP